MNKSNKSYMFKTEYSHSFMTVICYRSDEYNILKIGSYYCIERESLSYSINGKMYANVYTHDYDMLIGVFDISCFLN